MDAGCRDRIGCVRWDFEQDCQRLGRPGCLSFVAVMRGPLTCRGTRAKQQRDGVVVRHGAWQRCQRKIFKRAEGVKGVASSNPSVSTIGHRQPGRWRSRALHWVWPAKFLDFSFESMRLARKCLAAREESCTRRWDALPSCVSCSVRRMSRPAPATPCVRVQAGGAIEITPANIGSAGAQTTFGRSANSTCNTAPCT